MRKMMLGALIAAAATILSTPAWPATAKAKKVQVRQPTFEQCHSLALRRGITVTRSDRWIRDKFISDCMAGKIPF